MRARGLRPLTLLYEDQRGAQNQFGLHELVKSCVHDLVGGERYLLEQALRDCRPLKSDTKVLLACREELPLIAPDGRVVVAVFDNDRVRRLLKLPTRATAEQVRAAIRSGCSAPEQLEIVLLIENMETVLRAAATCDAGIDPALVDQAVRRKSPLARDAILNDIARAEKRAVRACVLMSMDSLREMVERVARLVR